MIEMISSEKIPGVTAMPTLYAGKSDDVAFVIYRIDEQHKNFDIKRKKDHSDITVTIHSHFETDNSLLKTMKHCRFFADVNEEYFKPYAEENHDVVYGLFKITADPRWKIDVEAEKTDTVLILKVSRTATHEDDEESVEIKNNRMVSSDKVLDSISNFPMWASFKIDGKDVSESEWEKRMKPYFNDLFRSFGMM